MTPLAASAATPGLWFKLESTHPSGSYKDRFIEAELRRGVRACVATSSGNTGSALAAGCARAGVACVIVVNESVPDGKLLQMRAHGATVLRIPQFTPAVFEELAAFAATGRATLIVSAYRYCPVGMRGVQAIAHELAEQLQGVKNVFVPVGGGGLYAAVARGFAETGVRPLIHAVQPEGCPTLLRAYRSQGAVDAVDTTTAISGLAVPFDIDATLALSLLRDNGGEAIGVTDEEVFDAQAWLLRREGIYTEPAGAAAFAGFRKAPPVHGPSVCLVTGSGAKDLPSIERAAAAFPSPRIEAAALAAALERFA